MLECLWGVGMFFDFPFSSPFFYFILFSVLIMDGIYPRGEDRWHPCFRLAAAAHAFTLNTATSLRMIRSPLGLFCVISHPLAC